MVQGSEAQPLRNIIDEDLMSNTHDVSVIPSIQNHDEREENKNRNTS